MLTEQKASVGSISTPEIARKIRAVREYMKVCARLGIGKAKLLEADKLPAEVREKRERYERILENHIGETGDYEHARENSLMS